MRHQTDLLPFPAPASPLLHCRDHLRLRARHVRKSDVYTLRDHQRLHACCIGRRRNTCRPGCCPSSEGISAYSISRTSDPTSRANSPPVWTSGIEKQGRVKPPRYSMAVNSRSRESIPPVNNSTSTYAGGRRNRRAPAELVGVMTSSRDDPKSVSALSVPNNKAICWKILRDLKRSENPQGNPQIVHRGCGNRSMIRG